MQEDNLKNAILAVKLVEGSSKFYKMYKFVQYALIAAAGLMFVSTYTLFFFNVKEFYSDMAILGFFILLLLSSILPFLASPMLEKIYAPIIMGCEKINLLESGDYNTRLTTGLALRSVISVLAIIAMLIFCIFYR